MNGCNYRMQALLEGVLLLLMGSVLLFLIASGLYRVFIAPFMAPCLALLAVVCLVWAFLSLYCRLRWPVYRQSYGSCLVVWIPLLLWLGPALLGASYPTGIGGISAHPAPAAETKTTDPAGAANDRPAAASGQTPSSQAAAVPEGPLATEDVRHNGDGIDEAARTITFTTNNYYSLVLKLTKDIQKYEGYEVHMIGFVSYDNDRLQGNEFILSRYLMACCINDLVPFGLACQYDGSRWPEFQWVAVTGKLTQRDYHGMPQPAIAAASVVPAKKIDGYIYPY